MISFQLTLKPLITKAGKKGSITCTVCTKELSARDRSYRYRYDYTNLLYPVRVYEIQDIKYDLPKPRKKKVKPSSEDPA
jgi:hypothetical protein